MRRPRAAIVILICFPALASGQGRAMLFSMNTTDALRGGFVATLEGAMSEQGFEPAAAGQYEQTLSAQLALPGRFSLAGRAGIAQGKPNSRGAGALELLREFGPSSGPTSMFAGLGAGQDFSHVRLAMARVGFAHKDWTTACRGTCVSKRR